jgi:hypothetical protein
VRKTFNLTQRTRVVIPSDDPDAPETPFDLARDLRGPMEVVAYTTFAEGAAGRRVRAAGGGEAEPGDGAEVAERPPAGPRAEPGAGPAVPARAVRGRVRGHPADRHERGRQHRHPEKEDGTLDLLLSSPITSRYYIWGKLRGLVSFVLPLVAVPVVSVGLFVVYDLYQLATGGGSAAAAAAAATDGTGGGDAGHTWLVFPRGRRAAAGHAGDRRGVRGHPRHADVAPLPDDGDGRHEQRRDRGRRVRADGLVRAQLPELGRQLPGPGRRQLSARSP